MGTTPTVGRIMWFYSNDGFMVRCDSNQPFKADVCYVHDENLVNVAVFDHGGNRFQKIMVPIVQDGSPFAISSIECEAGYLMWMPYQISKAAADKNKPVTLEEVQDTYKERDIREAR